MHDVKTCPACGETKPLDDFHRDRSRADGRAIYCKTCNREKCRRYREENRDKVLERKRRYHENNRDRELERSRQYYENNRDKVREQQRRYREENRDEELERHRRYREENRDYVSRRNARRRKSTNDLTRAFATRDGKPWTPEEDAALTTDDGLTMYQKAVLLGRTLRACEKRRRKLLARRDTTCAA